MTLDLVYGLTLINGYWQRRPVQPHLYRQKELTRISNLITEPEVQQKTLQQRSLLYIYQEVRHHKTSVRDIALSRRHQPVSRPHQPDLTYTENQSQCRSPWLTWLKRIDCHYRTWDLSMYRPVAPWLVLEPHSTMTWWSSALWSQKKKRQRYLSLLWFSCVRKKNVSFPETLLFWGLL